MSFARKGKDVIFKDFLVRVVPVLKDNYSYVVQAGSKLAAIDVSTDFEPVIDQCKDLLGGPSAKLSAENLIILSTHKHHDHCGGNADMAKMFPGIKIVGGEHEPVPHKTVSVKDDETFAPFGDGSSIRVHVMHLPYHTKGMVTFHFAHPLEADKGCIFTSDCVFSGGCGAAFEGNIAQMVTAMKRVAKLPRATQMFCGHDYAQNFYKYALQVEPNNAALREIAARATQARHEHMPTVPTTVDDELNSNVFMRCAVGTKALLERIPAQFLTTEVTAMEKLYNDCP